MNTLGVDSFEPGRMSLARDRVGATQRALAEALGVTVRSVQAYESGAIRPSQDVIERAAQYLGQLPEFFSGDPIETLSLEAASFRALSKASARLRNRAVASGTFAVSLLYPFLSERFELPEVNVPDLRGETPDAAAEGLRSFWGLGQRPISHMISLLESRGIRVFSLSEDCDAIDAFSLWRDGAPFIFLNTRKTAERSIFDAAHELGHLVLHRHGALQGHDTENEADRFASCFLMPEAAIRAEAPRTPIVRTVSEMKPRWRVSTAALGRRIRDLELMTSYGYTQFNRELNSRGRKNEPNPIPRETSVVLRKALAVLAEEGLDLKGIARELRLPTAEIRALTFGFGTLSGQATAPTSPKPSMIPSLRLVK